MTPAERLKGLEYANVVAASSWPLGLEIVNEQPLDVDGAMRLVRRLHREQRYHRALDVAFAPPGHYASRGLSFPTVGRIVLPDQAPRLRVGLVLHEFAHLLSFCDGEQYEHDERFVQTLDALVMSYLASGVTA